MSKLSATIVLSCLLALVMAVPEPRQQFRAQQQQLQHPYLFLSVPRGRANAGAVVQGFEIVEENDDDDDELDAKPMRQPLADDDDDDDAINNDDDDDADADDDDDDENDKLPRGLSLARNGQLLLLNNDEQHNADNDDEDNDDDDDDDDEVPMLSNLKFAKSALARKANSAAFKGQPLLKNAKATQMMVARDQAGAIMVPDGIVEIEGQSVVDEKTGKSALLVPRAALDAIPDGSVVALMERAANDDSAVEEERANRVIVRRRTNAARRGVQLRRRGGRPNPQRRRRGGQRRRPVRNNRRRNVRVIRPTGNRRRGNVQRRRGGQVMLQG